MTAVSSTTTSKFSAPTVLIGLFVAFGVAVFTIKNAVVSKLRIPPEATLGFSLPHEAQVLSSLRVGDGKTVSFFNSQNLHKISVARSAVSDGKPSAKPVEVIPAVITFQRDHTLDPHLEPLSIKFLSAELDARRAFNVELLAVKGMEVVTFQANKGAHYAVALLRAANSEFIVIGYRKGEAVDLNYFSSVLSDVTAHAN